MASIKDTLVQIAQVAAAAKLALLFTGRHNSTVDIVAQESSHLVAGEENIAAGKPVFAASFGGTENGAPETIELWAVKSGTSIAQQLKAAS